MGQVRQASATTSASLLKRLRDMAICSGELATASSWCKGKPFSAALSIPGVLKLDVRYLRNLDRLPVEG